MRIHLAHLTAVCALLAATTACGGGAGAGGASLPSVKATDPTTVGKLQFALGYATVARPFAAGVTVPSPQQTGNTETMLNVVATYRNTAGLTATLYNLPQLMGPSNFVSNEFGGPTNGYTTCPPGGLQPNSNGNGGIFCYNIQSKYSPTFVTSGIYNQYEPVGLTAYGFNAELSPDPAAYVNGDTNKTPDYTTYNGIILSQSYFDVFAPSSMQFYGGAPAFPSTNNGQFPNGFRGYPAGFSIFEATPVAGAYTLALGFPVTSQSGSAASLPTYTSTPWTIPSSMPQVSTTATFTPHAPLPEIGQPAFTADGSGGGSIVLTIPPGVTETWVFVTTNGGCYPFAAKPWATTHYTLRTTQTGTVTMALPDNLGPIVNGVASQTICTAAANAANGYPYSRGDNYSLTAVGFDYPAFAAAPPGNTQQTPQISNAQGSADVTISSSNIGVSP